mgnify:FL=1
MPKVVPSQSDRTTIVCPGTEERLKAAATKQTASPRYEGPVIFHYSRVVALCNVVVQ